MNVKLFFQKRNTLSKMAFVLCFCMLLTGCRQKPAALIDGQLDAAGYSSGTVSEEGYEQTLLSEDICVIPKKNRSATDSAITAGSALLVDDTDNKMLYAQKIYQKRYPASITKIVTALVALKYANLDDTVTISYEASHITEYGAKLCGFQEGDQVSMGTLLYSLLIYSGNDAGVAIAEHIAGTQEAFAERMNEEMRSLGACGTHFVNAHGLHDENHYTTAYDLYLVFHELLQYDTFREIINRPEYLATWQDAQGQERSMTFRSTDRYLLDYEHAPEGLTVIGGKTGTTIAAGSCLILYSQDEDKKDYISVILDADSSVALYSQMNHMLEYVVKK